MKKVFLPGPSIHIVLTFAFFLAISGHVAFAQRFEAATALTVGTSAQNVFVADFNKDGKPDLLVIDDPGGASAATLQVLIGNGDGTFQPPVNTTAITGFSTAAIGDFNGDGIPDVALAAANVNPGTITIFLGNGDGTFTPSTQAPLTAGNSPQRMKAVALNHTGILDLAVFNLDDNTVDVFAGKGDGTFTSASTLNFAGANPALQVVFGFAFGDFDGDGLPDLAVSIIDFSNVNDPTHVKVLKGNGDGTFQSPVSTSVKMAGAPSPARLAAVDFDGDGKLDLIFDGFGEVLLLPGNGDLTFQTPVFLGNELSFSDDIQTADMNGDGHPDIVLAAGSIQILLNDGHGKIASSQVYTSIAGSLAIADINGDGHPDFVAALSGRASVFGANNVQLIFNNGDGTMRAGFSLSDSGRGVVADFNNDGKPDIAAASSFMGVLLNSGNFQFAFRTPALSDNVGASLDAVGGDFNGDGNQDLVMIGSSVSRVGTVGKMAVVLGNGDGTLKLAPVQPPALPAPATLHKIAAADFNGDGKLDLAVTNMDTNSTTVGIYLGNGDGTFQTPTLVTAGSLLTGIAVGNFSGHGHLDIAVTNKGDGTNASTVSLLLGNGDGTFTLGTPVTVGVAPVAIAAGDLNGDGKLDLVVANSGNGKAGSVSVLIGNGDGTFQPAVSLALTGSAVTLTLADFNGDGFPDIAVSEHGSLVDLFTNKGDGTFPQVPEQYAIGGDATSLSAIDLNNGGLPDLVVSASPLAVLPNRGGARISFTSSQNPSATGQQVTFSATVVPNLSGVAAPSGTVQFFDGASSLGTVSLSAGTATFSTSTLTFGTHTIRASYSGDANFPARTFPNLSQVVRAPSSIQVTSSPNPSVFGSPIMIGISVTSTAAGTPTGNVSLLDGATAIASTTLDGSAKASFTISTLTGGTHSLTVSYAGDQTFVASVSNPAISQVVNQAASSSSLSSNNNPSTFGSPLVFTIHMNRVSAIAPTGTVSLVDGGATLASATLDASGSATFNVANLGGGTHNLTANYAGDQNYAASISASLPQVVNPASSASSIRSDFNPVIYSEGFAVTAKVSGPGNVAPSGKVVLLDGGSMLASGTLDTSGTAIIAVAGFNQPGEGLGAGPHNLMVSYAGDQNFAASASPVLQEVINKADSSVGIGQTPSPVLLGTSVSFIVGISPSAGGVPGMVSLLDGSTVIASVNVDANGFARFNISTLALGSHSISAKYSGDANRNPAASTSFNVTVVPIDFSISGSTSAVTVNAGQSATATLTFFSNSSFTSPVTFSCTGLPALASCSFNPATLTPNGTFQSTTVTITTTGPSASLSSPPGRSAFYAIAMIFPGFAGLLLLASRKQRRTIQHGILVGLLFVFIGLLSSCGGGGMASNPPPPKPQTPDGISTVVITANGGVTHQVSLTLTVQN